MSNYFITQFSQTLPKVLLLGDSLDFCQQLADIFKRRNFETQIFTFADCRRAKVQSQLKQQTFYKIFAIPNLTGNEIVTKQVQNLLAARHEPITFISRFDSTVDIDNNQTHSWYQDCKAQYNQLVTLANSFPRANFIIVRDLLLEKTSFHPAFNFIFSQSSDQLLTDPGISFNFVSQNSFLSQIEKLIFAPCTGEKTLFITDPISPSQLMRTLNAALDFSFRIQHETYPPVEFSFPFNYRTLTGNSDLTLLSRSYLAPYLNPAKPQVPVSTTITPVSDEVLTTAPTTFPHRLRTLFSDNLVNQSSVSITPVVKITAPETSTKTSSKASKSSKKTSSSATKEQATIAITPVPKVIKKPKKHKILSTAKKVLTSGQESFLQKYTQQTSQKELVCRRINLRGFNFISCAAESQPDVTTVQDSSNHSSSTSSVIFPQSTIKPRQVTAIPPTPAPTITSHYSSLRPPLKTAHFSLLKLLKKLDLPTNFKEFCRRALAHRLLILLAAVIAVASLIIFFFGLQPRLSQTHTQHSLEKYFQTCQDFDTCFGSNSLKHAVTFSLKRRDGLSDFATSVNNLSLHYQELNRRLANFFAVSWQNQNGDPAQELEIVTQTLTLALEDYEDTQRQFTANQTTLAPLANQQQLLYFTNNFASLGEQLHQLQNYLPLLQDISNRSELHLSLVGLDDNVARTGGGLILGVDNLTFNAGKLVGSEIITTDEIATRSSIKAELPSQLASRQATSSAGLANLTFARDFASVASLLDPILQSGHDFQPDLVVSMNLDTLDRLQSLLFSSDSSPLKVTASTQDNHDNQIFWQQTLSGLHRTLAQLSPAQAPAFLHALFSEFTAQNLQFVSLDDNLHQTLLSAGLFSGSTGVLCPSGFGSSTCILDTFVAHEDALTANPQLQQQVNHQIILTSEETTHRRTMVFTNDSSHDVSQYLTFSLPQGATLDSLDLDGRLIKLDNHDAYTLALKPGQTVTLTLTCSLPRSITSSDFTYSFYNEHQNGLANQSLQISIKTDLPYIPRIIAPSAINNQDGVIFNVKDGQDFLGALVF
ncbi:hypothetical protein IJJ27_01140 [bacterium]|nr:hypothetical protein [bacterium]